MVKTYEMVGKTLMGEAWQELEVATDFRGNPDSSGEWVRKDDYDALAAEIGDYRSRADSDLAALGVQVFRADKAEARIRELEAALREAREDDHVGGGLTTATVDRINALIGPQSDAEAKS